MAVAAGTRIGFIGAGQMAEAIAKGLNSAGVVLCDQMIAADVNLGRCKVFQNLGIAICASNMEVAEASDVLILAVKPQIGMYPLHYVLCGIYQFHYLLVLFMFGF
jgi:pyrroline-5-carboxylate reductase